MTRRTARKFWQWIEECANIRGLTLPLIESAMNWPAGRLRQAKTKSTPPSYHTMLGLRHLLRLDWEECLAHLPQGTAARMRQQEQEIGICLTCPLPECQAESIYCPLVIKKRKRKEGKQ